VMRLAKRGSFPVVAPPKSVPKSSSAPKPDESPPLLFLFPFPFFPPLSKSCSASARASAISSLLRRLRPPAHHPKCTTTHQCKEKLIGRREGGVAGLRSSTLTSREISFVRSCGEERSGTRRCRLLLLSFAIPLLSSCILLAVPFELLPVGAKVGLATGALPHLPVAARRRHSGERSNLLGRASLPRWSTAAICPNSLA